MTEQRFTEKYWQAELQRAEKEQDDKRFRELAEESIEVYEGTKTLDDGSRRMSIWWAVTQTVLPAYYSNKPEVEVTLKKKVGDDIARVGAITAERNTQYALDEEFDFDKMAHYSLMDYLLVGRGAIRARYDAATQPKVYEYAVFEGESGLVDANGKPYKGDPALVTRDERGMLIAREEVPELRGQRAYLERIHWRDYREQCARQPSECEWKAVRGYMSRDEAKRTLGGDIADKLQYTAFPDDNHKRGDSSNLYEGKAETWEIWCESTGKVYFFSGAGTEAILEPAEPPLRFSQFYPFATLDQNIRLNSTVPLSDYVLLKDQLLEVERLTTRMHAMLAALKFNAAYDSALGAEIEKLFNGDLKLVPVKFPGYKGEQALARAIEINPLIEPIIRGLKTIIEAREVALGKIYEQTGSADIVRGMADPNMTATQANVENSRANWRFSFRQKHVTDWFGSAIGKLGEIVCTQYAPEKLYEVANAVEYAGTLEQFIPIAEFLRSDPGRRYRISIKSDSMGAVDEAAEHKERTDLMTSCGAFLGQLDGIIQQHPSLASVAMELMRYTVRTYKGGKDLEPVFMSAVQQIAQEVQQKAQQPDPGAADAQVKLQIAQMQIQSNEAVAQLKSATDRQIAEMNAQVKLQEISMDAQAAAQQASMQAAIEQQKAENSAAIERIQQEADTQVELIKAQIAREKAESEAQIKALESHFAMAIETRKRETEELKAHVSIVKALADMQKSKDAAIKSIDN